MDHLVMSLPEREDGWE